MWTWYDRDIAEREWRERLADLSPEEIAEMVRRQDEARKADYWEAAFKALWEMDEQTLINKISCSKRS